MTTSLVISIVLFAIFTIPEISCQKTCMGFNERCVEDSDCCSDNCYMSGNINKRFCMDFRNTTYDEKVENGWCSYNQSFHNETSDESFRILGINAAHAVLPVGSKVKLINKNNNSTIDVTINTYLQPNNGTLLQLSKEAAIKLGVKDGETIQCSISLYEREPNYSPIKKIIGLSASFFVVVFVIMSFL